MNKDNLNIIFKNAEGQFDTEEPAVGHKQRFLDKLNNQNTVVVAQKKSVFKLWKPILGVAASVVLLLTIPRFIKFTPSAQQPDGISVISRTWYPGG